MLEARAESRLGHSQMLRVDFPFFLSICAFCARRGRVAPLGPHTLAHGLKEPTKASDLDIHNDHENDIHSDSDSDDNVERLDVRTFLIENK